ncbi:MAG: oligosaccharide flippase family protein [Thermoplasmata archaeon]|nr:oligosaccharide flippase family protein [Thermoplasmata archaeon]
MAERDIFINKQDIKTRFLTTLFVNILKLGLSFLSGIIIARSLGPADYGNFNFLLVSFASIIDLLDMGTSSAFYTFLSQKKRSSKFYLYYLAWLGVQFLIGLFLIALVFPDSWQNRIWLGHKKKLNILAFFASFMMTKIWQTATQAGESIRATVIVQLHSIALAGFHLCTILAMVSLHCLTITNLFIIIAVEYLLFTFILAKRLKDNLIDLEETEQAELSNIIKEFKIYCTPLIIYSIVSFAYSFADTWLLQRFGGAVQQGFYSVGLRFSTICLIATTSMLRVFWKEIGEAHAQGNKERLYYLYTKISRALFFVAAVGACFLIPFSKEILVFLLGPKYKPGWLCLAIMFLYPIHQSLGQISGSYFCATAQTKLYSKIAIARMIFSIFITYFVLASPSAKIPGLGLGSVGLALKMVILQIIGVNIFDYIICGYSRWKTEFSYRGVGIILLLIISFISKGFLSHISHFLGISLHSLLLIIGCIPIYISMVGLVVYLFPGLSGIEKGQLINLAKSVNKVFSIKKEATL